MNTIQAKEQTLLDTLHFSPKNKAMALTYLAAPEEDVRLLAGAERQDFAALGWAEQEAARDGLELLRRAGKEARLARYIRLYWAVGGSTAVFLLEHPYHTERQAEERARWSELLGKSAAAALEAEGCLWRGHFCGVPAWLHEQAAEAPQVLEEAQSLSGGPQSSGTVLLAGVLLAGLARPGVRQRLLGGGMAARQAALLYQGNLEGLEKAAPALQPQARQALAAYIQRGEPDLQLPTLGGQTAYDARPDQVLGVKQSEDDGTALLAGASFLGQRQDARARCAVRVWLALNPGAALQGILNAAPRAYLLDQLDVLLQDLTGRRASGRAVMLLFLTERPLEEQALRRTVAERCAHAVGEVLEVLNAGQYLELLQLLPKAVSQSRRTQQEQIIRLLERRVGSGGNALRACLTETGSMASCRGQLSAVQVSPYTYLHQEAQLAAHYRETFGWDDFSCRCGVSLALLFCGYEVRHFFQPVKELAAFTAALLERDFPFDGLLRVAGTVHDWSYDDREKAEIRAAVCEAVQKPDHLEALCAAAGTGEVFGRYVALMALDGLCALPACAGRAKAAILEAAGDPSKQIQTLLLSILEGHLDWAPDCAALLKSKKAAQRLLAVKAASKLGETFRPALEEALAGEKSAKVADAIRAALGAKEDRTGSAAATADELALQVLKGGKRRKLQWLLEEPLPALCTVEGVQVGEDRRDALLAAYYELGRIGRSGTADELAAGLDQGTLSQLAHEVYERWLSAGAQSKNKWVLPFAAVFGGPAMTAKLTRAIQEWPQHARGAIACDAVKALTLSPDPAALLTVDAISRKFKFRQVKRAAADALAQAAQELGITPEELADRIVPDLGFTAGGTRVFDYGPRRFTVRLTPTMELEITNDSGKTVKSLPAPGKSDEAGKADEAYASFKTMKKQMRATVAAQKNRLEAALSALRCWDSGAWQALFVQNPIMHQFAISLIWGVYEGGALQTTFRYMEDGSFNTVDEEEYTLPEAASIGLVHPVELDDETREAWKRQLEDYEISPSLLQLDRPVYRLEPEAAQSRALERFGGKMLNGLSLSGKLLGLGWYRGSVQDGGGYYTFYREDPALGCGVELNFSGCCIGDENETVTVYEAVFYRAGTVKRGSYCYDVPKEEDIFPLGAIPARYYSEVVYQLERATSSSGETDPDWKHRKG